jgi:hypothetical protein
MGLKKIMAEAEDAIKLEGLVQNAEERLKELKGYLRISLEKTLPDMFAEAGLTAIDLEDGGRIALKQIFAVNIPAAGSISKAKGEKRVALGLRLDGCIRWLRENNCGDVIKNEIIVQIPAGREEEARKLFLELKTRDFDPF